MRAAQAKMRQAAVLAEETSEATEFAAAAFAQSDMYKAAAEAEAAKAEAAFLKSRTMPKATEVESPCFQIHPILQRSHCRGSPQEAAKAHAALLQSHTML